jgi:hypothetical protein
MLRLALPLRLYDENLRHEAKRAKPASRESDGSGRAAVRSAGGAGANSATARQRRGGSPKKIS